MSTKNPFFVSPPTDFQQFGSGKFLISYAGSGIKLSTNGGTAWQTLPPNVDWGTGTTISFNDVTDNSNDKTITVPAGKMWKIAWIYIQLTTTATSGDRRISLAVNNGTYHIWTGIPLNRIGASTNELIIHSSVFNEPMEIHGAYNTLPFPASIMLPAGYTLRFRDDIQVDGNDDMDLHIIVQEYNNMNFKEVEITASDLLLNWSESIIAGSEQQVHVLKID